MMNKPPQLIIAGDSKQAYHLAHFCMGLQREDWRHIDDGRRDWFSVYPRSIWLYGTFYTRRDWPEIEEQCRARGITLLHIEERR